MRVMMTFVGIELDNPWSQRNLTLDMEAVPREGETVTLPDLPAGCSTIRTVVWYPMGDPEDEASGTDPFVYVVVGHRRGDVPRAVGASDL